MKIIILSIVFFIFTNLFSQSNTNSIVGLMRADGIMIPLLGYKKSAEQNILDSPSKWRRYDRINNWQFYKFNSEIQPVIVRTTVKYNPGEEFQGYGLLTNYCPDYIPASYYPMKIAGIVSNDNIKIEWFDTVNYTNDVEQEIKNFIIKELKQSEIDYGKKNKKNFTSHEGNLYLGGIPASEKKRDSIPYSTRIYSKKSGSSQSQIFHIFIDKKYPDCRGSFVFHSWILYHNNHIIPLAQKYYFTDCDYKEGEILYPLALLTLKDQKYIVTKIGYYSGEDYTLFKIQDFMLIDLFQKVYPENNVLKRTK